MQRLSLSGQVLPLGARLLVRHDFLSAETRPIEVVYCFALPRDAALRRFQVAGQGFSAHSSLKPVREAEEDYEAGLEQGHLGVLARQYRDGLVNLSVGNLQPGDAVSVWLEILAGVELRDDGLRFRFPFTLAPSYHSKARAAEVEPGVGEIELPGKEFGDVLLPQWRTDAKDLHEVTFDVSVEWGGPISELSSPSHALRMRYPGDGCARASLAPASEVPNRDLVLDVRGEKAEPRLLTGEGEDGRRHFAAVIPSTVFGQGTPQRPPFVFLLDRSGSMGGAPMEQARNALVACLAALEERDRFGVVAFDNVTESLGATLTLATAQNRRAARDFLAHIDARGGTELVAGVHAALALLKPEGIGDIFLITDGQVFGTEEIVAQARGTGVQIHCLGIGSASQDRFLALLARETGGVSRFVTARERVDTEALELFASASAPVAGGLQAGFTGLDDARLEPEPPAFVRAGAPVALFGQCEPGKEGKILLDWGPPSASSPASVRDRSRLEIEMGEGSGAAGETLRLLRGARLITDLEIRLGNKQDGLAARDDRDLDRLERHLEEVSRHYGLSSRMMALVAVVQRAADSPGAPPKTLRVALGSPQDVAFRAGTMKSLACASHQFLVEPALMRALQCRADTMAMLDAMPPAAFAEQDPLTEIASLMEPDGGMPGSDDSDRLLRTLLALLAFASEEQWPSSGPYRVHLERMLKFVDSHLPGTLSKQQAEAARRALQMIKAEKRVAHNLLETATRVLMRHKTARWTHLQRALAPQPASES